MENRIPGLVPGRTAVMAVVNVTPDSFSDGGRITSVAQAVDACRASLEAGAHILDIGGQSTRPGAVEVGPAVEMERVLPVIRALRQQLGSEPVLSIDTFWAEVAEAALREGVNWINDVSGGNHDPAMLSLVARWRCPYVLMHRRGNSRTMDNMAHYKDVVGEVEAALLHQTTTAQAGGVQPWQILWDPGLGFAKTTHHNLTLLHHLSRLSCHGYPLLVGPSRKRFIGEVLVRPDPCQRVWGTAATVCKAVAGGAAVVRIHDVEAMAQVVTMADALWPSPQTRTCSPLDASQPRWSTS
ncbi:dihydropteroate synthase [Candidatus Synechococcus spongiarum LMB bulk10D]|nr:dihydropteroate synthase [Candidatus Synechococcus spongiarum LMB bulk10D]